MEVAIMVAIAVIAVGAVLMPLLRSGNQPARGGLSDEALDFQVAQYRAAMKSGTLCESCLTANPAGSRFCKWCGRTLG